MGRMIILKSSEIEDCWGSSINSKYDLCLGTLLSLVETLEQAKSNFKIITAVRLDFSIKKAPLDEFIGSSNPDIMECFADFMNRLYKDTSIEYVMNWKLEWSESKGFHIHTVFYFNHSLTKAFTLTSKVYELFISRWNTATDENGNINICTSCIADDEDTYKVRGGDAYQYAILAKDITLLNQMKLNDGAKKYHQQKNQLGKKCGFFHWVSYLAKTEQVAPNHKKRFGTKIKINKKRDYDKSCVSRMDRIEAAHYTLLLKT